MTTTTTSDNYLYITERDWAMMELGRHLEKANQALRRSGLEIRPAEYLDGENSRILVYEIHSAGLPKVMFWDKFTTLSDLEAWLHGREAKKQHD